MTIFAVDGGESEYGSIKCRHFMESHGIEVVDLGLKECRELMEECISKNKALWDEFLSELNPDLLV